jgi:hypothetical protein
MLSVEPLTGSSHSIQGTESTLTLNVNTFPDTGFLEWRQWIDLIGSANSSIAAPTSTTSRRRFVDKRTIATIECKTALELFGNPNSDGEGHTYLTALTESPSMRPATSSSIKVTCRSRTIS